MPIFSLLRPTTRQPVGVLATVVIVLVAGALATVLTPTLWGFIDAALHAVQISTDRLIDALYLEMRDLAWSQALATFAHQPPRFSA